MVHDNIFTGIMSGPNLKVAVMHLLITYYMMARNWDFREIKRGRRRDKGEDKGIECKIHYKHPSISATSIPLLVQPGLQYMCRWALSLSLDRDRVIVNELC